ncbi:MAG: tRNA pseudouridine(38-40) synthase TruA [Acidimicrobiales bacterium]|nr:tRNA pseudouridine(38-40) synthase TruA [Acidimicrobiales bacterium]
MKMKATVAYRGSGFHGFAINEDVRTVAGDIEAALAKVVRSPITITCAGRTDKGVHGKGQVISFDVPDTFDLDPGRLTRSINQLCRPDIVLRDTSVAAPDFDARFSATWRRYRYQVLNSPDADPLRYDTTWHVPETLDLAAMNEAARPLVGTHDFASFCRRPKAAPGKPEHSLVRDVLAAEWREGADDVVEFWIQATSFCHQMVRSIVGTTVDVGLGRIDADAMPDILDAKDRDAAGRVAPPEGLTLWQVGYR